MLTCPICGGALTLDGGTFRCPAGHAFDRAREGYVDLLPIGHGRSGITGDTRDMAAARRRFLARGHYYALAALLRDRVVAQAAPAGNLAIAEVGCGEGHYIGTVADALPEDARLFGFDVSRAALRLAARAHPAVTFAVNDVKHRLCLEDGALDALLDVFAPRNPAEFRRVLRPDGLLLVVIPGERHLSQLRDRLPLLGIQPEKRERTMAPLAPFFDLAWEELLEYDASLPGEDVADLVGMTPSAFHLEEGVATSGVEGEVTFSFHVMGFRPSRNRLH